MPDAGQDRVRPFRDIPTIYPAERGPPRPRTDTWTTAYSKSRLTLSVRGVSSAWPRSEGGGPGAEIGSGGHVGGRDCVVRVQLWFRAAQIVRSLAPTSAFVGIPQLERSDCLGHSRPTGLRHAAGFGLHDGQPEERSEER